MEKQINTAQNSALLNVDTTVNFTSSMTAAQIQALINAQPLNLNGHTLTFQFADGTYTLSALKISGIYFPSRRLHRRLSQMMFL